MIQKRAAHFQRVRHAGAIYFYQNVVYQVSLDIDILNARQRIGGVRTVIVIPQHVQRIVPGKLLPEVPTEEVVLHSWRAARNSMEVPIDWVSRQALERRLP